MKFHFLHVYADQPITKLSGVAVTVRDQVYLHCIHFVALIPALILNNMILQVQLCSSAAVSSVEEQLFR